MLRVLNCIEPRLNSTESKGVFRRRTQIKGCSQLGKYRSQARLPAFDCTDLNDRRFFSAATQDSPGLRVSCVHAGATISPRPKRRVAVAPLLQQCQLVMLLSYQLLE